MHFRQFCISLLALSISQVFAQSPAVCPAPIAGYEPDPKLPTEQIRVTADRAELQQNTVGKFEGHVNIESDNAQIQADNATIDKTDAKLNATGSVSYKDQQMVVQSSSVLLDTDSGRLEMQNTEYQLTQFGGRGAAETITIDETTGATLSDVEYTTCPVEQEDWKITASEISMEEGKLWGEAKNTVFYVKDIPVFYLPYFVFPISDERQSGLLFPELTTSSSTGLSYEQPIYWNIAPNFDATISPKIMSKRGVQLKTEFRYLQESGAGQINIEYLPEDQEDINREDRYFYRYIHTGKLSDDWHVNIDFNGLSDDNYIVDFGSDYYNRADTHLYQTMSVHYLSENLDFSAAFRDFEVIGDHPNNYRTLPEMKLNYRSDSFANLEFRMASELAYFESLNADEPNASRLHLAPSIALPIQNQYGEFLAEATLLNTFYRQENIAGTELSERVNRSIGQARVYGALYLERDMPLIGKNVRQTLEPKVQYLYTEYENQNDIGLYDTTRLLNDVNGLFRGQEFTGLDRISDNNQVTVGLTTRILDDKSREQFKLSLGQIFYLEENRVLAASKDDDRSALASELDWKISSRWFSHTELQLSTKTDKVERSSISLEYKLSEDKIFQISHRYVRNLSGEKIDQVGLTASWPLSQDWHWVGRWYKDLENNRTIESYVGLQYESCCWSLSLVSQRHLSNRFDANGLQNTQEFETSFNLKFSFKFTGSEARLGRRDMLRDGLFGYRQAYLIN